MAFAFDRKRVTFTGLAFNAEGPRRRVGEEYVREVPWWRPPFLASFRAGRFDPPRIARLFEAAISGARRSLPSIGRAPAAIPVESTAARP